MFSDFSVSNVCCKSVRIANGKVNHSQVNSSFRPSFSYETLPKS